MTQQNSQARVYPMMPLRDIVLFPYMVAPLIVGRSKSVKALEYAMANRTEIVLSTQPNPAILDPKERDIYPIGTFATVMQLLRLPDGTIKALVEGKRRAKISGFVSNSGFYMITADEYFDMPDLTPEVTAYMRMILASFKEFARRNKRISKEVVISVEKIDHPGKFADVLASHLPVKVSEKQEILNCFPIVQRLEIVYAMIQREIEVAALEMDIRGKVKKKMEKTQRDYYLSEQMRTIKKEMGDGGAGQDDLDELAESIRKKKMPKYVTEKSEQELKKLRMMPPTSAESTVVRNYLDCIVSLPWRKKTKDTLDVLKAEKILDEDHFGLQKPKERILEYLAVQKQVKKIKGPILCLVGPPGVGKTSLCKSVARAMGRKFVRQSLGGVRDEAEIRGHRRTYIGAMPGKILQSLQKVKVNNPVVCLDEIDKMSMDFRGDPSSALLEVLDPEQNSTFNDHYLDMDYDLSDIFFITTANNLHAIPRPLMDRMEVISIEGYTEEDKLTISKDFLVEKQMEANGFHEGEVKFADESLLDIIRFYTREAGVRNLERCIASIYRKVARDRQKKKQAKKYRITVAGVSKFLGTKKFRYGLAEEKDCIGLTTGLAWTEVGGELLQIETVLMPGSGKLIITGKLGEVMQESAQAALGYIRSRSERLGIAADFYNKLDIHVHVPEGAIPKDGPSAGITMTTSIVSALLQLPIRRELAMTGEVTLRGRVLPIGGLTQKLLAARRGNITHVIIPKENERNLKDVPAKILRSLTIDLVDHVDDVLRKALVLPEGEELFKDNSDDYFCPDIMIPATSGNDSGIEHCHAS